jgi:NADPH-dependent 2,4-dienoyl-CoA reductase/sulfur reductase-like enzyme
VELAEAFNRIGKKVTLIDNMSTCLSGYYDREFTDIMSKNLESHGIKLAYEETVTSLKGNGKVEKVVTDKNEYAADMVVLGIGFKPNSQLGKDNLKLFKNGAYLVDRHQQTSIPDVYAIGDCATVFDNSIQATNYIALASNAVRSGIVAAHNACGTPLESIGVQGSNGICIWNLKMVSTGISLEKAKKLGYDAAAADYEDTQKPAFIQHDNYKVKIRIVYDKKTRIVLGAQMCSEYDISMAIHMFSLAIQEQVTIDRLKLTDIFFLPHFNKPYNYFTMAALQAE